jgi:hypothetical protein
MTAAYPPSLHLATLYEKTSQRGTKYFAGRLGLARVTLLQGDPTEDGAPTWKLLLQQAPTANNGDAPRHPARRGRSAAPAARRRNSARPLQRGPGLPDDGVSDLYREAP